MKYDEFGQSFVNENELTQMIHINPDLNLELVSVSDPETFNKAVEILFADLPMLKQYIYQSQTLEEFDTANQAHWFMPEKAKNFNIMVWLLKQCNTQAQKQRVGQELLLFGERGLFPLLRFLKYMIDTFRKNDIVWGVGRGSSVSSYILFLIGVHKIDSMYYDLDITEFLR